MAHHQTELPLHHRRRAQRRSALLFRQKARVAKGIIFPSSGLNVFGPPPSDKANAIPGALNSAIEIFPTKLGSSIRETSGGTRARQGMRIAVRNFAIADTAGNALAFDNFRYEFRNGATDEHDLN
jgi:hypothetical protein